LNPAVVALVMAAWAVQLAVSSWKWQWALRVHGLNFPYFYLTRVLVIGFFLNNFLPTSIGGDAYRIFRTVPVTPPKSRAISAVLLERLVGLSALLLLGVAGALVLFSSFTLARAYVLFAVIGATLCVAAVALIRAHSTRWRDSALLRSKWISPAVENLRTIARARGAWIPLVGISLLFQIQAILIVWSLFDAIDFSIGLPHAALIAASAGVAAVIPFSINGLGIVEATIAGTAVAVGVSYEAGLLVALLMRILLIPLTLLAGLFYAFEPPQTRETTSLSG
jgi:glycosyltransferase 2 family protein